MHPFLALVVKAAQLEHLWLTGKGESEEADTLRVQMDPLYKECTHAELRALAQVAAVIQQVFAE